MLRLRNARAPMRSSFSKEERVSLECLAGCLWRGKELGIESISRKRARNPTGRLGI